MPEIIRASGSNMIWQLIDRQTGAESGADTSPDSASPPSASPGPLPSSGCMPARRAARAVLTGGSGVVARHNARVVSRIAAIAIDARQPEVIASFWCAVLGWRVSDVDDVGISISPSDGSGPTIDVYAVPEAKTIKNRLHLDLRADGASTSQELRRLLDLGARRVDVGQPDDASWVVLADPEGNEFCLLARPTQDL